MKTFSNNNLIQRKHTKIRLQDTIYAKFKDKENGVLAVRNWLLLEVKHCLRRLPWALWDAENTQCLHLGCGYMRKHIWRLHQTEVWCAPHLNEKWKAPENRTLAVVDN